jgi:hypothetical protein
MLVPHTPAILPFLKALIFKNKFLPQNCCESSIREHKSMKKCVITNSSELISKISQTQNIDIYINHANYQAEILSKSSCSARKSARRTHIVYQRIADKQHIYYP